MKRPSLAPSTFALDCLYLSEKQVLTKTKRRRLALPLLALGCQALALKGTRQRIRFREYLVPQK
jgi:hypothetical protein